METRKLGRKKIDRKPVYQLIALGEDKQEIKEKMGISERTYFSIKAQYDKLPEERKAKILEKAEEGEEAKRNFGDYEFVQKWMRRISKLESANRRFNICERAWLILQKKNPENWTEDDIKDRVLPEFRKTWQKLAQPLVALRSLRPDLQQVLPTEGEKYEPVWDWKYAYEDIIENKRLEEFYESARISHLDEEIRREQKGFRTMHVTLSDEDCETLVRNHVTWGCREGGRGKGGLLNTDWSKINWNRKTIDIFESKVRGGVWWLDCPMDLFDDKAFEMLRARWERLGKPKEGKIFSISYDMLRLIYKRIAKHFEQKCITPHFARKLHASLLAHRGIPLEIVAGDHPKGLMGSGWLDLSTLKKFYITFAGEKLAEARRKARLQNP